MTKNEWLATEVMGWKVMKPSGVIVFANNQRSSMKLDDWNPADNIEQAFWMMAMFDDICVFDDMRIMKEFNAADLCIWGSGLKGEVDSVFRKTLPEAITEAVLQASGYYETTTEQKDG